MIYHADVEVFNAVRAGHLDPGGNGLRNLGPYVELREELSDAFARLSRDLLECLSGLTHVVHGDVLDAVGLADVIRHPGVGEFKPESGQPSPHCGSMSGCPSPLPGRSVHQR